MSIRIEKDTVNIICFDQTLGEIKKENDQVDKFIVKLQGKLATNPDLNVRYKTAMALGDIMEVGLVDQKNIPNEAKKFIKYIFRNPNDKYLIPFPGFEDQVNGYSLSDAAKQKLIQLAQEARQNIQSKRRDIVKSLVYALNDPVYYVRQEAANQLSQIGKYKGVDIKEAVYALIERLKYDGEYDVKEAAAYALRKIGTKEAIDALNAIAKDPKADPDSRKAANNELKIKD